MSAARVAVQASPQFSFRQTVFSHGWYMLAPFSWDAEQGALQYIHRTARGDVIRLRLRGSDTGVSVALPDIDCLDSRLEGEMAAVVRSLLNMDWDLRPFYDAMRQFDGYHWLETEKRGRILVGGSLWEDLAKVLLTTNTTWAQTIQMCARLCQLGAAHPTMPGCHAFPTAQQIAGMDFEDLAEKLRAGYRNAYLSELAQKIVSGEVDLESWLKLEGDSLYSAVKSLKGFGAYAAGTMARMYGHFDKIAIDSACRDAYAALHNDGAKADDDQIKRHYACYGAWQGLVMWMDIMRGYS